MPHRGMNRAQQRAMFAKFRKQGLVSSMTEKQLNRPNYGGIRRSTITMLEERSRFLQKVEDAKAERCVKALKGRSDVNPYAVCRASAQKGTRKRA